jgi:hypothetical protein
VRPNVSSTHWSPVSTDARHTRLLRAARIAVAGSFGFLVAVWIARPWVGGDTPFVLDGSNAFLTCLSHHDYSACGFTGKLNYWGLMSPIGDWPLLQHVPDLIAVELGVNGHPDRTRILATLSVVGIVASVLLARIVLSRAGQAAWFWGFMLIVLGGPILAYARTTAGEMLAMGLLVCLVAAALLQAPPAVVALAALGACWTKETAYPFVAVLGLLGLVLARRRTARPIGRHVIWGAAGMTVGIVTASLFNIVRFGSVLNKNYLDSQLHTPGVGRKLEYTVAVFVSPSGGVSAFWPAASVLLLAACLVPFARHWRGKLDPRPAIVLIAVAFFLAVGFASWWTPFGWSAYGPRLALPWVLPLVLIALVAYGEALGSLTRRLLARWGRLLLVGAGVLAFTLPSVGYMWRPETIGGFFRQAKPLCDAPWRGGVAKWHACQSDQMWLDRPMPLYALDGVRSVGGAITSVAVAIGLLGCLILLREELRPAKESVAAARPAGARAFQARPSRTSPE